jgi:hypothetical protein
MPHSTGQGRYSVDPSTPLCGLVVQIETVGDRHWRRSLVDAFSRITGLGAIGRGHLWDLHRLLRNSYASVSLIEATKVSSLQP